MALFSKKAKDASAASDAAPMAMPVAPGSNGAAPAGASGGVAEDFSDFSEQAMQEGEGDAADAGGRKKRFARPVKAPKAPKAAKPKGLKGGSVVGLNIGNDSIKIVELKGKGTSVAITAMGMTPTPQESISNGVVMSTTALSRAIRELFQSSGIKSKNVVSSVSGTGSLIVRIIEVPRMSDSELADNMKVDLDRYIPFPPSEVIMDFKALRDLPSDPDAANMEVLLAAAQREIVDLHIKVLQGARLSPQAIDVEPLAAARGLFYEGAGATEAVDYDDVSALVNIGATGTEISVMRGDILVFTRSIPSGGNTLTQALVDSLGMAWPDAERLKIESGDALSHNATQNAAQSNGYADPYAAAPATTYGASPHSVASASTLAVANPAATSAPAGGAGDDWSSFDSYAASPDASTSQDIFGTGAPAPTSSPTSTTPTPATAPAVAPEVSGDPFDMDFFSQGPSRDEPEEQHRQKSDASGDKPDDALDFSTFDFGSGAVSHGAPQADETPDLQLNEDPDGDSAPDMSTHAAGTQSQSGATAAGFDFSQHADASTTSAPSGQMFRFDDVDDPALPFPSLSATTPDDDLAGLPSIAEDDATTSGEAGGNNTAQTFATEAPATSAPAGADFSFDDFDLTPSTPIASDPGAVAATQPEPGTPVFGTGEASALPSASEVAPAFSAAQPSAYDTSELPPTATAPDTFAEVAASPNASNDVPVLPEDDFDFESLASPTGTTAVAGETGFGAAPVGADTFAGSDAFAADDAFAGAGGFGASGFGDDLSDFGAGLGGAVGVSAETLHGILSPLLEELVAEVRRSLEYYASRYPDAGVRRVTLVGGGARLTNIDALFTQSLGIPTTTGNPLSRLPLRAPKLPAGYREENGPIFAVALGLALRDLI